MVCRRNGRCIAHQAGFISDKDYYGEVVTPRPADLTGNGAMLRADEDRKRLIEKLSIRKDICGYPNQQKIPDSR